MLHGQRKLFDENQFIPSFTVRYNKKNTLRYRCMVRNACNGSTFAWFAGELFPGRSYADGVCFSQRQRVVRFTPSSRAARVRLPP